MSDDLTDFTLPITSRIQTNFNVKPRGTLKDTSRCYHPDFSSEQHESVSQNIQLPLLVSTADLALAGGVPIGYSPPWGAGCSHPWGAGCSPPWGAGCSPPWGAGCSPPWGAGCSHPWAISLLLRWNHSSVLN